MRRDGGRGCRRASELARLGRHFVTFQFPIVDLRPLKHEKRGRLRSPAWPEPRPGEEFVRGTGVVQDRPRGAIDFWDGERSFVDARKLLRIEPPRGREGPAFRVRYRRLYASAVTYRVDVGFDYWLSSKDKIRLQHAGTPEADAARELARLAVRLGNARGELTSSGPHLAQSLSARTTSSVVLAHEAPPRLRAGRPLAMVEVAGRQERSIEVATALSQSKVRTPIYVLRLTGEDRGLERNLRAAVWRLHSEIETIQEIARQWTASPDDFAGPELLSYLDQATQVLIRQTRTGARDAPLMALAMNLPTFATTEMNSLVDLLEGRSKGIRRRLQVALERAADADVLRSAGGANVVIDRSTYMSKNKYTFNAPSAGVFGNNNDVRDSTFDASGQAVSDAILVLRQQLADLNSSLGQESLVEVSNELGEAHRAGDRNGVMRVLSSLYEAIRGAGQAALPALESIEKIQGLIT